MNSIRPKIFRIAIVLILVIVASLAIARQALAASASISGATGSASSDCTTATFSATFDWSGGTPGLYYWVGWTYYIDGVPVMGGAVGNAATSGTDSVNQNLSLPAVLAGSKCEVRFSVFENDFPVFSINNTLASVLIDITGASATVAPPDSPPGVWLAGVCEPEDGFSTAEYGNVITIGSDANSKQYGNTLYVGTSADGPWTATGVAGPNYILTKSQVEALAASLGLADYHDLWFKVSDSGIAANLGSMIADREAKMDSLCNPE